MCHSSNLLLLANAPYLLPKNNKKDASATDCFYFVSASGGIVFEYSIPALHDKRFIGCQYGWLAIIDAYSKPSLFNILTSESISLPSIFSTLPGIRPAFSLDGSLDFYWRRSKIHCDVEPFDEKPLDYLSEIVTFSKLVISSNPSLSTGEFVVAALFNYPEYIAYTMPGWGQWKFLDYDESYVDLVFCQDGTLLGLTYLGGVYRFQLLEDGDFVKNEVSPPFASIYSDNHKYLVEDSNGNGGLMQNMERVKIRR